MVKRIIVVDSDVSGDEIKFVQRQSLPHTVTDLDEGEYFVTNTKTNNSGVLVTASTAPAYEVPVVTTPPSWVLGNTTVGTMLEIDVGAATGVPTPDRKISYTRNGNVLTGQIYTTLDTAGFVGGDVIVPRVTWTNLAGSVSVSGEPLTLTSQPAITATIDLQPAGQQSSITFNVAINGSPTIAQGSTSITATRVGTTNQWTFVAPVEGPISFAATKAGYTAFSDASRTVAPPAPQLAEQNGELVMRNVTTNTPPFTLPPITEPAEYAGTYDINPADFISGAIWLVAPQATQDGDTLTLLPGLPIWLEAQEPVVREIQWMRGTSPQTAEPITNASLPTYTINIATDGGKTIYPAEIVTDKDGQESISIGTGIAVEEKWWHDAVDAHPGSFAVNYTKGLIRTDGQTMTLADARAAQELVVNGNGSDTLPVAVGTSLTLHAKGVFGGTNNNTGQYAVSLDDGADGDALDNLIRFYQGGPNNSFNLYGEVYLGGTRTVRLTATYGGAAGSPFNTAFRFKSGSSLLAKGGVADAPLTGAFTMPAVSVAVLKNSSLGTNGWVPPLEQITFINGDIDAATVAALTAPAGA